MKILLPIDGSDCSKASLKWATKVMDKQKVQLYLLSIVQMLPLAAEAPMLGTANEYISEKEMVETAIKEAKAMLNTQGFQVEESYAGLSGDPAYSICEYANEKNVDQIMIGSHGKTGLEKILMGSVSQKVFRDAKQPVLVINNIQQTLRVSHADQIALEIEEGPLQKVLIPIDGSECTKITLQWAAEFLNPHFKQIYLIHVSDFLPESRIANYLAIDPVADTLSQALAANEVVEERSIEILEEARRYMESRGFSVPDTQYLNGKAAEVICDYATQNKMDLILIGSHGRTGLLNWLMGSVAQAVFKNAKQPVILFSNVKKPSIKVSHLNQVNIFEQAS